MNVKSNQISRFGAYGVFVQDSKILLTLKKSGPYKGLWDLPGGGIEFGESPEEALKREFLEEVALEVTRFEFFHVATSNCDYHKQDQCCHFHHIGMLYRVLEAFTIEDRVPDEEGRWITINDINQQELTPFASYAVQGRY